MVEVMVFYTNNAANGTQRFYTIPEFQPSATAISINCLFFASLSVSLVAALASVVSLQWVADYDAVITRGGSSPEDRAKRRQFRYAGVITWKMGEIIAALPLLLYCSVLLFFIGLIQWMWNLHPFVGAIVSCGAGIAVLFYSTSTMLAVISVSAPFRTPTSQWIYNISLSFMSTIYTIAKAIGISSIPPLFQKQHDKYMGSQDREDRAVRNRNNLGRDALVWLAKQLSLSRDSHRRFLLLVGQLFSLQPEPKLPLNSKDIAWEFIFDTLAWRILSVDEYADVTAEDRQAMLVLQKCWTIPEVQHLIAPTARMNYTTNMQDEIYWSQFTQAWMPDYDHPNYLFLLFRDIPISSSPSNTELDAMVRLGRWRYSNPKTPQVWDQVFHSALSFSPTFFNSCIKMFAAFAFHCGRFTSDRSVLDPLISRICDIAKVATRRKLEEVDLDTIISLLHAYQSAVDTSLTSNMDTTVNTITCIFSPLAYGSHLRNRGTNELLLHDNFILLLSGQLRPGCPSTTVQHLIPEIITMLWLRPVNTSLRGTLRDLGYKYGMHCSASKLRRVVPMHWIESIGFTGNGKFLHVFELLERFADVQAIDKGIGLLWRATAREHGKEDAQFVEASCSFDSLIQDGCTPAQHDILIRLVCQDLELGCMAEEYFTQERVEALEKIKDPCLRFLSGWARNINAADLVIPEDRTTSELGRSWVRIENHVYHYHGKDSPESVVSRQAALWPLFSGRESLCERALSEPDILVSLSTGLKQLKLTSEKAQLRCIFHYPVHCPECYDGPGHLLFHILTMTTSYVFVLDITFFGSLPMRILSTDVTLLMLCRSMANVPISLERMVDDADEECIKCLSAMFDEVESSQLYLFTLLCNSARRLSHAWVDSEELVIILAGVRKALSLPDEAESVGVMILLSRLINELQEMMTLGGYRPFEERQQVSVEANKTYWELQSRLATRVVLGGCNSRLVSCAQAGVLRASVHHLPVFE